MKRNVVWIVGVGVLSLGAALTLYGSDNPWGQDYAIISTPGFTPNHLEPTHTVGRFQFPPLSEEDTFVSYVYTYGDVVIFSYDDSSEFEVVDSEGNTVWSGTLMEDDYHPLSDLPYGVYRITSPKGFSVLSGDPWGKGFGVWTAVDENSSPLSTKFLSVGPSFFTGPGCNFESAIVVFAYYANTHVALRNLEKDEILWEGDLDSAELYYYPHNNPEDRENFPYSVESTRPVSTMALNAMGGLFVPAYNGTFTGRDFMTYMPYAYEQMVVPKDLQVVPWEDETWVTIVDLENPLDTIWHVFCENRGEIKGKRIPLPSDSGRALFIHSDKVISVCHTPWESYSPSSILGYFLMRGVDKDGFGIGKEFYLPLEGSADWSITFYSRLHVVAYSNNTNVKVARIPRDGGDEMTVWQGTLGEGEYYRYTCPVGDESAYAIYHVTASEGVGTIVNCYDNNGADFFPVVNLAALGISEEPPVTHPSNWQVLTPVGQQITLQYSESPKGFHASVFDAAGRKVDELHSSKHSGMIIWPVTHRSPGVYFIKVESAGTDSTEKVVLTR